ncbi:aminotransferase class V-fold PLP-dependent enzyme [Neobacillus dielmonensis]|uniref:aminotransferase class V-fold PLP-dependent enzyme n=1 Tax=Neobacillus dielmonensis TaxID=1347369 RepID=UPI0005A65595|nr:aminotransferase class V-fold PLP-dependent enzyme [Neobacillus dielmonensis]
MITKENTVSLEEYFLPYYNEIIGNGQTFETPFGKKAICYADWTASGRLYQPIEDKITHQFGPFVANTHTETNVTGKTMTEAYHTAKKIIKKHVNANENDVLLFEGTGMTGAICKLQRILGLSINANFKTNINSSDRPVVFITHMEHHSNHTSWEETLAEVVIVPPNEHGDVCPDSLESLLEKYKERSVKIGSFTACSNVSGVKTPYYELAKVMHKYNGYCFVDFSASAPYESMNMHPEDPNEALDAIFFSPHKFLGGPSSTGIVIFNKYLYKKEVPDRPGGGTVNWTNPWGGKSYIDDIEVREDGGTPGFLQAIRAALAIKLKEKMGIDHIEMREKEIVEMVFKRVGNNKKITLLEPDKKDRLPIFSFYVSTVHHNLVVKLLNDVHGIQVRGGCSCAGTYGHYLLNINQEYSKKITDEIDKGNFIVKPGWIRVSFHPTTKTEEIHYVFDCIEDIIDHIEDYQEEYDYCPSSNEFKHKDEVNLQPNHWFEL